MAQADPLVSVIIPTFNRERYLREAVASVFAQTYTNWELIVADDGSTDGTRDYLASLHDPRVRILELARSGNPSRVRNEALAHASGRYIAFLDDDDLWNPEKLALQVADLATHPECRWTYSYFRQIGPQGQDVPLPAGQRPEPCRGWIQESLVRGAAWVAPSTVLVERSVIVDAGGFDESLRFSEDYDAFIRIAASSQASLLATPLAGRRVHPGNSYKSHKWSEVYGSQVRVYGQLLGRANPSPVRRAARREYMIAVVRLANSYRTESRYAAALSVLLGAALRGVSNRAWWMSLLKACVQPLLPAPAMRRYYRWRNA